MYSLYKNDLKHFTFSLISSIFKCRESKEISKDFYVCVWVCAKESFVIIFTIYFYKWDQLQDKVCDLKLMFVCFQKTQTKNTTNVETYKQTFEMYLITRATNEFMLILFSSFLFANFEMYIMTFVKWTWILFSLFIFFLCTKYYAKFYII